MTAVPKMIPRPLGTLVRRLSDCATQPGWSWYAITLWCEGRAWMTTYAAATPPDRTLCVGLHNGAPAMWVEVTPKPAGDTPQSALENPQS